MKTNLFIKKATLAIVAVSMLFIVSVSQASSLSFNTHKKNHTEKFHKVLEEKGYTNISQFSVTKSDVHQSKYFVNFVNDNVDKDSTMIPDYKDAFMNIMKVIIHIPIQIRMRIWILSMFIILPKLLWVRHNILLVLLRSY